MDEALLTDLRFHRLLLGFDQDCWRAAPVRKGVRTAVGYCIRPAIGASPEACPSVGR